MQPNVEIRDHDAVAVPHAEEAWSRMARTRDGVEYNIHPVRENESTAQLFDSLAGVSYRRQIALFATIGAGEDEVILAAARYRGNPAYCEFWLQVAPEWQSRGVGKELSNLLFAHAKSHGVRRMYTVILAGDAPMLKLAAALNMNVRNSPDGNSSVEAWRTL